MERFRGSVFRGSGLQKLGICSNPEPLNSEAFTVGILVRDNMRRFNEKAHL